jgi:hypothetical protein
MLTLANLIATAAVVLVVGMSMDTCVDILVGRRS